VTGFTAILDACVLHPAPVRDLLLESAGQGLYRGRWTDHIHDEWIASLLARRSDLSPAQLARTRALIDASVLEGRVTGYEQLIEGLWLPDPGDRHVLAAAIRCGAGAIVTYNLKDFPAAALETFGIEAQHPDELLEHLLSLAPAQFRRAAEQVRLRLRNPPVDITTYHDIMERQDLRATVSMLRRMER